MPGGRRPARSRGSRTCPRQPACLYFQLSATSIEPGAVGQQAVHLVPGRSGPPLVDHHSFEGVTHILGPWNNDGNPAHAIENAARRSTPKRKGGSERSVLMIMADKAARTWRVSKRVTTMPST